MSFPRSILRVVKWLSLAFVLAAVGLLLWGRHLLVATDLRPSHADAVVALQGSIAAEKARIAGTMELLQRDMAGRALLSVPKESYWGQSIPPVARAYLERTFGPLAARVDFCEIGAGVNSTAEEAEAIMTCVQQHGWHTIVIMTSDYHTRRAGILWRRMVRRRDRAISVSIESVADPDFQQPWWRHRQSAKIFLSELLKLAWTAFGG